MGSLIVEDGRGISPAHWAFAAIIRAIAEALPHTPDGAAFRDWMISEVGMPGFGMGRVDLRELTPENRTLFWDAAQSAFKRMKLEGPLGWSAPCAFPKWLKMFQDVLRMRKLRRRGGSPEAFNPYLLGVVPPTGRRSGPGWENVGKHFDAETIPPSKQPFLR